MVRPAWHRDTDFPVEHRVNVLMIAMPELADHQERTLQALGDLEARGLADAGAMSGMMTDQGLWVPRTTALGNRFLDYISDPVTEAEE
jgi:hypothetical protein